MNDEKTACPLCDMQDYSWTITAKNIRGQVTDELFHLARCNGCGLIYGNPRPSEEDLRPFYANEYYCSYKTRFIERIYTSFFWWEIVHSIRKNSKQGKLLDIGCGRGDFLLMMKTRGYDVYGTDTSDDACRLAGQRVGKNIFNGKLKDRHFADNYFGIATIWGALEHMVDPVQELQETFRVLKNDGLLIVEVPNIDCLQYKIFRENWYALDVPRHVCHYSLETLERLLARTKFKIFKVNRFTLGYPLSLFRSFANYLRYKLGVKQSFARSSILLFLSPVLLVGSLLLILASIFTSGETIRVYARKEV